MQILEVMMMLACLIICALSAVTDLKKRKIPNSVLYPAFGIVLPIHLILYYYDGQASIYLRNLLFASGFSILLYAFHFFSAGDSKLLIVLSAAMPICFYQETLQGWFPIMIWLIILFSISFLYLIGESISFAVRRKEKFRKRISFRRILLDYFPKLVIVTAFSDCIWLLFPSFYEANPYIIVVLDYFLIVILNNHSINLPVIGIIALGITDIVISIACGYHFGFQLSDLMFLPMIIIIWLLQSFLSSYNYYSIPSDTVEKDMILSMESSLLMQTSNVQGLPAVSTEDTRSKLTEDEAQSIRRWAKSKQGQPEIILVRTLPFGTLIALGTAVFLLGRGIVLF